MAQFPLAVDEVVQFHAEITSASSLRAVVTAGLQWPVIWSMPVSGDPNVDEKWKLRKRGIGENDDGVSFILPNDNDPVTNNVIWVRIS